MSDLVEIIVDAIDRVTGDDGSIRPRGAAREILDAIEKAGHRIVPVEPTYEMVNAPPRPTLENCNEHHYATAWRAMLAAAPKETAAPTLRQTRPLPPGTSIAFDEEHLVCEGVSAPKKVT